MRRDVSPRPVRIEKLSHKGHGITIYHYAKDKGGLCIVTPDCPLTGSAGIIKSVVGKRDPALKTLKLRIDKHIKKEHPGDPGKWCIGRKSQSLLFGHKRRQSMLTGAHFLILLSLFRALGNNILRYVWRHFFVLGKLHWTGSTALAHWA